MRNRSSRLLGMIALAGASLVAGCSSTTTDTEYEDCVAGDSCTGDTVCTTTEFTSGTGSGSMCTASCAVPSDCPPDSNGAQVDCVINAGEATGQCYIDCTVNGPQDCEGTTQCASLDGVSICVP